MPATKESPLQRLHSRPGFLLRRAHQISVAIFEKECAQIDLTPAQYSVLSALRSKIGLDQTSLARAIGFDKVTTLRVLHLMEKRNLVDRTRLESDRRTNWLRLTREGIDLYNQAQRAVDRAYKRLTAPFSPEEETELTRLLQHLVSSLEEDARAALVRETGGSS